MEEGNKAEIKEIIEKAEISLVLDTYDDIFSDFDPRPYSERALSEDFLYEAKKATRDKEKGIELRFLIPNSVRNTANEDLIKSRLKNHFRKHYKLLEKDLSAWNRQALIMVIVGAVIGFIDAFLLSVNGSAALFKDAVEIILTPASWYTIWTGFDHMISKPKESVEDRDFYKKMVEAKITFTPY